MSEGMGNGLAVRPLQWAALPELVEAAALDAGDMACLHELRAVLMRHGRLDRFAVHLAHRHFELSADEILIEQPDAASRTQHVRVGRKGDHPEAVPTTWLFEDGPELRLSDAVYCTCQASSPYGADSCGSHRPSPSPTKQHIEDERKKAERISEDRARHEGGFPVGGHDQERER